MVRRIGISVDWQGSLDREQAFERVRAADQAGVDVVWVAEAWGRDAFTRLTQLAERTERMQLGTAIVNIYSRTPAALAQHFATLDELSGGRMIVGLGNSGPNVIEHFHGVPFQPAFRRMRETVAIMRALFAGEPLNYEGDLFHLQRGFTLRFDPVRTQLPFYLATLNPRSVRMTAEIADGWLPVMIPLDRLRDEVARVRAWAAAEGKDAEAFTVRAPGGVFVANSPETVEKARMQQAGSLAFYCARMGEFYYRQLSRQGYEDEANAVRTAWKDGGSRAGASVIPETMLDQFHFVGNTEQCLERLDAQAEAGATLHQVTVLEEDPDQVGKILEVLVG